jgi:hypothetical protein
MIDEEYYFSLIEIISLEAGMQQYGILLLGKYTKGFLKGMRMIPWSNWIIKLLVFHNNQEVSTSPMWRECLG